MHNTILISTCERSIFQDIHNLIQMNASFLVGYGWIISFLDQPNQPTHCIEVPCEVFSRPRPSENRVRHARTRSLGYCDGPETAQDRDLQSGVRSPRSTRLDHHHPMGIMKRGKWSIQSGNGGRFSSWSASFIIILYRCCHISISYCKMY